MEYNKGEGELMPFYRVDFEYTHPTPEYITVEADNGETAKKQVKKLKKKHNWETVEICEIEEITEKAYKMYHRYD